MKRFTFTLCCLMVVGLIELSAQNAPINTIGNVTSFTNTAIVPIKADNFNTINSCNLKVTFDPSIAILTNVTIDPGVSPSGTINVNTSVTGEVYFQWFGNPTASMPNGSTIFNLHFTKAALGTSPLTFLDDNNGNSCKFYDANVSPLNDIPYATYYINGSVTFAAANAAPVTTIPNTQACPGQTVNVPVTVTGFNDVGKINLLIYYTSTSLTTPVFSNTSGFPNLTAITGIPGIIFVQGESTQSGGHTYANGTTLFTLQFNYQSGNGSITFDQSSYYAGPSPTFILKDQVPFSSYYINGSVSCNTTPPTLTCPASPQTRSSSTAVYTAVGTEFDPTNVGSTCPGIVTVTNNLNSGSTLAGYSFTGGTTTVTWTATDVCGNTAQCSFDVQVTTSGIAPVTSIPFITACPGQTVNIPVTVTGFNNVGSANFTILYDPLVLSNPSFANTSNIISFGFNVPTAGEAKISGLSSTPGGHTLPDGSVLFTLSFTYNGGTTSLAFDHTFNTTCQYGGPTPSYTPLYDLPKSSFYIDGEVKCIPTPPSMTCVASPQNRSTTSLTYTTVGSEFDPIGVTGSCSGAVLLVNNINNSSTLDGYPFPGGTNTVIWTATDVCGNTSTCTFDVVVTTQGIAPVTTIPFVEGCPGQTVTIPVTVTGFTNIGAASFTINFDNGVLTNPTFTNTSGVIPFGWNLLPSGDQITISGQSTTTGGHTLPNGSVLFTLTFTYLGGSTGLAFDHTFNTTCQYGGPTPLFTPLDDSPKSSFFIDGGVDCETQDPVVTCPASPQVRYTSGTTYLVSGTEFNALTATDNCPGALTLSNSFNSSTTLAGATLPAGTTTITWTATDACSNQGTCSFDVQVIPLGTAPITTIPVVEACLNQLVTVPVTVKDFDMVGAGSFTILYNTSALSNPVFINTSNVIPFGFNEPSPGQLTISGQSTTPGGHSLPDDAVLFTLQFTYTGGTGSINFDHPFVTTCQYGGPTPFFVPFNDSPKSTYFINGEVKCETEVPVISTVAVSGDLGCNPGTITPPVFTGLDNCDGIFTPSVNTTGPSNTGCAYSQTWTATYTDACGNAALPVGITYTWTEDTEDPVLTVPTTGLALGCNPTTLPSEASVIAASSATDNCGTPVITASAGAISGTCTKSQTFTVTATDGCGNTDVKTVTYTWTDDTEDPVLTVPTTGLALGCNPATLPTEASVIAASSATDNCGTPVITASAATISGTCTKSQTFTVTATDGCGNTDVKAVTYTWTEDAEDPVLTVPTTGLALGCNPTTLPSEASVIAASSATDNCGTPVITASAGTISGTCTKSQEFTVTATDGCGNTDVKTVTYTWTDDTQAPVFAACPTAPIDLGCNPSQLPTEAIAIAAAGSVSDNCDLNLTMSAVGGTITGGCVKTQIWTVTADADCGPDATCTVTYTWTEDTQAPVFAACPTAPIALGCNPSQLPTEAMAIAAAGSVSDNCDLNLTMSAVGGTITGGCVKTQIWTVTADADCGPDATCTVTYTWIEDTQAPVFATCPTAPIDLGCNPSQLPNEAMAIAAAGSVTDNCDATLTMSAVGGTITGGCVKTQIWTVTADADCGPDATCTVTYTWTEDTQAPVFAACPTAPIDLGCNPSQLPTEAIAIAAAGSVTDNCDATLTMSAVGGTITGGCVKTQIWTVTADADCGPDATCTVTYTWTEDTQAPVFAACPTAPIDLGCNPSQLPTEAIAIAAAGSVSDNCDLNLTMSAVGGTITGGCVKTQIWTVTADADCGPDATCTVTYTWTVVTAPVLAGLPTGGALGCNPTTLPSCDAGVTASNECGSVTVDCTPGSIVSNGCNRTQTFTYSATECGLTTSADVTYTWTVVTAPVLAGLPTGGALGCNPTTLPSCDAGVTASNECGSVTVDCTPGSIISNGCNRTQTFTYSATDCGLTTSADVTYTWTVVTAPVLAGLPTGGALGCNPTTLPSCDAGVTASNECGSVTVDCTPGSIVSNGCNRTQTFTYSATDCGLTTSADVTYTWTVVTAPVLAGLPTGGALGCNPTTLPSCDANVTASNECGSVTVDCTPGSIVSNGCNRTQTFTYSATECGLTTSADVTYTWTVVTAPVLAGLPTGGALGCNPTTLPSCDAGVTASNECGSVTVDCTPGSIVSNGCNRTQTFTYSATDCGLTTSADVTYTWTVVTAPVLAGLPTGGALGCNPTTLPSCDANVTASNECGSVTVDCTPGSIVSNGCNRTQTFTYSATECGLTTSADVTYTWTVVTAPVLAGLPTGGALGCNPTTLPSCDANVTASNECGSVTVDCTPGSIVSNGCNRTQTFTYSATDCGLTTSADVTYTWTVVTAPVLAGLPTGGALGCNPTTLPSCDANVTASNECGSVTVDCTPGSIVSNGCNRTQTFTYSATDCGLTTSADVTYTWTVVTAPVLAGLPTGGALGCNPATLPSCDANVTASNECGSVTVDCTPGSIVSNGCNRTQTFTYSATECGLTTSADVTYTWTVVTAPVLAGLPTGGALGCNPTTLPSCDANVTASNECGSVTVDCTPGSIVSNGCNRTQTFTYSATECGLTTSADVTYTWTVVTAPVLAGLPTGGALGCNPATLPSCDAGVTASNECGSVTVDCTPGSIVSNGCNRTQTFTYSATDCGLTTSADVTYTWTVVTAPVLAGLPTGGALGCNPATLPSCDANVTASNECGSVTVDCTPGSIVSNGCNLTQTFTYSATDCGLTTSADVTYTWTVVTAPVLAGLPTGGALGCNPTTLPSCDANVTASNECGSVTVDCTPGSIVSNGCNRTQTFTYSATECGLTTSADVTYTWTVVTAPVLAGLPTGGALGCNPTTLPSCDAGVTASNECGSVTVDCTPGSIVSNGCNRTQTFTYSATDCGLTTSADVTYTWTVVTAPVLAGLPTGGALGCNPTTLLSCDANVTASNECGSVTVDCTPGSIVSNGCNRTQTFTYSATDCGLTTSEDVTYTWTIVTAPVLAGLPTGGALGCNPATLPSCDAGVTASNECGSVTVDCTPGSIVSNGCNRTQTFTYSATDCGLTTSADVTYTWTVVTAPVLAGLPTGGALGCNPTTLPSCDANVTASNECGSVTVDCTPGSIVSNGCNRTQTFTYSATECGLTTSADVTYTWTVVTAPVLAGLPTGGALGCNPTTLPSCDAGVTASNECGSVTVDCTPGSIVSNGCNRTQTFTYSATDCGLTTSADVTYTWTVVTAPVLAGLPTGGALGCNPTTLPSCDANVTASNECGSVTVDCTPGSIVSNGCNRTQTFTYSATDCGLTTSADVTYTWTVVTAPVLAGLPTGGALGCNPTTLPSCDANVTASNECGSVTVDCTPGSIVSNGCNRTQTFTYSATDCGLTTSADVTYTWTVVTAPVLAGLPTGGALGCNPTTLPSCDAGVTASNECGSVTVDCTPGSIVSNGCNRTQTFTYSATDCGLTTSADVTYTWTVVTAPVLAGLPTGGALGCNPATLPSCDAGVTASNECGSVTVDCTPGSIVSNGCNRTQTFTYSATDCGLTTSADVTYTWTVVTAPVLAGLPTGGALGCNPATLPSCDANVTASNECGSVTVDCTPGSIVSNGCNLTQTFTYTATDCGLTTSEDVTYTWTIDSQPPTATAGTIASCYAAAALAEAAAIASTTNLSDNCTTPGNLIVTASTAGTCTAVVTVKVADECGNFNEYTYNTRIDNAPPTISCPATQTIPIVLPATSYTSSTGEFDPVSYADNCPGTVSISHNLSHTSSTTLDGYAFPVGTTTVVWTAQDVCGNTATCSFNVTVAYATTLTCPPIIVTSTDLNSCSALISSGLSASYTDPDNNVVSLTWEMTGAVSAVSPTTGINNLSSYTFPKGTTTITYTLTYNVNQTLTCSFTVTVNDNQAPAITCPANTSLSCASAVPLAATDYASFVTSGGSASDNCPGTVTVVHTGDVISNQTCPNRYTITRTYMATDESNNSSVCTQIITVNDQSPPTANPLAPISGITCISLVPAPNPGLITGATDNCGGTVTVTHQSDVNNGKPGCPLDPYVILRTYKLTDVCGNASFLTQTIAVEDNVPPQIACPGNLAYNITAPATTYTGITPGEFDPVSYSDNCGGTVTISHNLTHTSTTTLDGYAFPLGTTTVIWKATDACGNTNTCTFTVTVTDNNQAPSITCPQNIAVNTDPGDCNAQVSGGLAPTGYSDPDNNIFSITWTMIGATTDASPSTGTNLLLNYTFNKGITTITYRVTDAGNLYDECSFTVTVDDNEAPVPDVASLPTLTGECSVTVTTTPTATDNCEGTITGTTNDPLSYNTQGTFTITWTYDDGNGNTSTQLQTVIVDDNTAPVPDLATLPTLTGECSVTVTTTPTATDNCEGPITGITTDPLSYTAQGTYTITWTYDDGNGNTSTQLQTVIVDDNTAPVPDVATLPTITGECSAAVTTAPTATDNCVGTVTGTTTDPLSYTTQGTFTITWTFSDGNGNASTQTQTVIVDDVTAPVPDVATLPTITGECSAAVTTAPTATDNCVGTVTGTTTDPLSYATQGTFTITWTFSDGNGNSSTQTQTVIVDDVTAPVPDVATLPTITGECSAAVTTAPTATDNCIGTVTGTTNDPLSYNTQGTFTITWTYDDGNGNTSTQLQTVIVDDNTAPVPDVATLPTITGECSAAVTAAPTATDNCEGPITGTTNDPLSYNTQGTFTITWTFSDGNGNASTQTQTVIVDDVTAPVPDVATLPTITGECSAAVTTAPTATDNCVGTVTGTTTDPLSYATQGTFTITWTFSDGNGNSSTQTQTVIVDDVTAPVPDVATLPTITGECSAAVTTAPTATDNCIGTVTGTTTDPLSYTTQGTYTITWTYDDGNGNTSTQLQTVIVDDNTAPVPDLATLPTLTGECSVTVTTTPTATDNCEGTITGTTTDPLSYTAQGTYTITWTYDDGNGNTSTQLQTVIVDDVTAPVPDVATLPTITGECSAAVTTAPTATDNCVGTVTGTTTNPLSYNTQGTFTITWTYDDGNGNTSTQLQTVIVDDNTPPTITCQPSPQTRSIGLSATTYTTVGIEFDPVSATDNCGSVTLTNNYNNSATLSGAVFPLGTTTVIWTATDASNNTATCTLLVVITQLQPPTVTCPPNIQVNTDPNLCTAEVNTGLGVASYSDPDGTVVSLTWTMAGATTGSSPSTGINNLTTYTFNKGVTTITYTVTDNDNLSAACSFTVTVIDNQAPVPDLATLPTITGECSAAVTTAPTATDNCVGTVTGTTTDPLSYATQGTFTITWTFSDGNGNSSTQTQTVIVDDVTAPVPDVATLPTITGECSAAVTTAPTATDNCIGTVTGTTTDPLSYTTQGTYTITWTYDDGNGNTSTQLQTVIVDDNTAPVPDLATLPTLTGECSVTVTTTPTATDNCEGTITGTTTDPLSYTAQGTYTITWTYDDGNGNTSTQLQTVIVDDVTAPVPDVATLPTITGECSAAVTTAPTATDNCVGTVTGTTNDPLSYNTQGTFTITWTYDDGNGNTSTQLQTVIVDDNTAPVPDVATLPTITGECSAAVTAAPTATDNCEGPITGTTNDPLSYNTQGTFTITWTFSDGNGNASTQTQTVIVDDVTAPVPDVATLPTLTGECSVTVTTTPTATDNCVGTVTGTTTDPLSYTTQGTFTITWTFSDGNGNASTQTQTVIVDDVTAPVPDLATLPTITGECSASVTTAPTATDNCVGTVTGTTTDPLSYTAQGTYTITWTYDDGNGNTSTQLQSVIVDDVTAPVPDLATLPTLTGECSVTVTTTPTATDNCVGTVTGTTTDPLSYNTQGTFTITWTFSDGNGNASTQTQTVIVDDNTAPVPDVATLPTLTGECSVTVTTTPTATDNCVGTVTGTTTDPLSYTTQGTFTITWTFSDGNGNASTQTQTVIVDDVTAPVPDLATLPTITGECSASVTTAPTATDNCVGTVTGTTTDPLSYTTQGTFTITWTFSDGNGNASTQTQTVIVDDNTAPVPDVATLPTVTGECSAAVTTAPTATDNCVGTVTGTTTDPLSYTTQGTFTITWTYDDGNGNTSTQLQTVIVDDVTAPVPDVATLPTITGECSAAVTTAPTATDNCVGTVTGTTTNPLSYNTQGTFTITWTYDDGNGNTSTQLQTVIVDDNTPPTITCQPSPQTRSIGLSATTYTTVGIEFDPVSATDNCGSVTLTNNYNNSATLSGAVFPLGTTTVIWTATDASNNTATCTLLVVITQLQPPTVTTCSAALPDYRGLATTGDNCATTVTVTQSPAIGSTQSGVGTLTVTLTANDGNGNTASCTFEVNKVDNTPPMITCQPDASNNTATCTLLVVITQLQPPTVTCPPSFQVNTDPNLCTAAVNTGLGVASYSDPDGTVVSLTWTMSGATTGSSLSTGLNNLTTYTFNKGVTTITYTVTDNDNLSASCSFAVTVTDNQAPVPDLATLPTITGECSAAVTTAPTATDNCVGTVTGTTTDPLSYTTQGTFTITWTFSDGNGNASTQTQTVIVDDITAPVPDLATLPTITGECSAPVTASPTATDNCEGPITGTTTDPLSYTTQGTFTITWIFSDGNGNASTQTQTVIVDDNTAPVPDVATLPTLTGECSVTVTTTPTATDNCVGTVTGTTTDPLSYTTQGTYTITWTFSDGNGNASTQTQTVVVDDITAPVPDLATLPTITGECSASVTTAPTATDNCVGTVTGTTTDPLGYTTQGTFTITWIFSDGNGNASTQTQTVIVDDVTAPVPNVATLPTITGECSAAVTTAPTATDNCVGTVTGTTTNPLSYTTQGTFTITWTFSDGNGNASTQTQTVIVDDNTAPVPDVATLPTLTGECSVTVTTTPTATDNCVGTVTGTTTDPLSYTTQGTFTITWTFSDGNGNASTQTQTVIVDDNTAPVPDVATLPTLTGECSVTVTTTPTATDNCVGTVTGTTTDPLSYTTQGTFTITWTFSDGNGNASTQTQTVIVDDITAPVPDLATLPTITGECSAPVTASPTATDNCEGPITGTTTDPLSYTTQGTFTITWTFSDGNGNASTQTQTVIVDDVTPPVPDLATLPTITGECSAAVTTAPTATDNCVGTVTGTTTDPLSYTTQGTFTITWTFSDGNGNASTQTQTVVVDDVTPPVPDLATLPTITGECSAAVTTAPTATDNCEGTITGTTTDPLSYNTQGTFTITWTFSDGNGNASTQTQTVIVDDNTAPVPDVATLPTLTGECSVTVTTTPTATDNCVGTVTGTTTDPLSYTTQGTFTITWTFSDGNGNSSTQTQTVIVDDVTAPVPDLATLPTVTGECSAAVTTAPTATDNCVGTVTGTTTDPLSYTTQGTFTITWTFSDGNGNGSTQTQTVIVDDVTAPVPNVATLPTITGECSAAVTTAPTATDNCVGTVTGTTTDPLSYTTQGTFTITWTFSDGNGNASTQTQTVIVDDNTAPTISCQPSPQTRSIGLSATTYTAVGTEFDPVSAGDNCGSVTLTNNYNSSSTLAGAVFPLGTTTVIWTATDASNNTATCTLLVVITQLQPPTVTCPPSFQVNTDPNLCTAEVNTGLGVASYSDPDGTVVSLTWTMAGATTGSSPSTGINNLTTYTFNKGVTTITYTVTDNDNLSASCSFAVTVTDNQAPVPDLATLPTITGECSAAVTTTPTATDNCVGTVTGTTTDPLSYTTQGTFTITWTFSDGNGNASTQTQTVIVDDVTAPVPDVATLPTITGECSAAVTTAPTATDNCVGTVTGATTDPLSYTTQGTFTITWTFSDGNGNASTQTQTVIVDDNTPPVPDVATLPTHHRRVQRCGHNGSDRHRQLRWHSHRHDHRSAELHHPGDVYHHLDLQRWQRQCINTNTDRDSG
jgi:large repetitive protein